MDQLRQEIVNLEAQEAEIEQRLNAAETDDEARKITDELNIVRNNLSAKKEELRQLQEKEQARAEVIEAKVQDEAIPFAVAGIDFTELPAEVITLIDEVVKADRRRILREHEEELKQVESAAEEREIQLKRKNDELQQAINAYLEENNLLRNQVHQLTLEKQDAEQKRDAAVTEMEHFRTELDKANTEIDRLNSQIDDYQKEKVFGERQAQQIIDVTPEENNSISAAIEAVKKLYAKVEDWGSVQKVIKPDGTFELTTRQQLAEEWAPIEPPEVPSFRGEDSQTDIVAPEVAAPVEDTFPNTAAQHGDNQGTDGSHVGTVPQEAVTRAEFEALKQRVEALETARLREAA